MMIRTFEQTARKSSEWVAEVMAKLGTENPADGLQALRAGLHVIRDRLPPAEVVDLGAQLPMAIRGLYYEGWRWPAEPANIRDLEGLKAAVHEHLDATSALDPLAVLRAVITVLAWHVSGGEIDHVTSVMPKKIAALWKECIA